MNEKLKFQADQIKRLRDKGIEIVRLSYCDIHGIARGKDMPLGVFENIAHKGVAFCISTLTDGLASNSTYAPGHAAERGYPDMCAKPLLSTLIPIPWEPRIAWCLAELEDKEGPLDLAPRQLLKRVVERYSQLGLTPVVGPELEFFLLQADDHGQISRYSNKPSMAYMAGKQSDPEGVIYEMLRAAQSMEIPVLAVHHEYCRGQFEINMLHGEALDIADHIFRCKVMIKELAVCHGLLATFMGKPFNDDDGAGFHMHLSINDQRRMNIFAPSEEDEHLSAIAQHFLAGIIEHAKALMAFLAPTVNAYKRLVPNSLVPIAINWGYDNRTSFVRALDEHPSATRLEIRVADGASNPYLAIAVCLLAGLDGIQRQLEPPLPVSGDVSIGIPKDPILPRTLEISLDALRTDNILCEMIGWPLVNAFCDMKSVEIERFRTYVTNWEQNEYMWHL